MSQNVARAISLPRLAQPSSAEVVTTGMVSICARSKISARVNQIVC